MITTIKINTPQFTMGQFWIALIEKAEDFFLNKSHLLKFYKSEEKLYIKSKDLQAKGAVQRRRKEKSRNEVIDGRNCGSILPLRS